MKVSEAWLRTWVDPEITTEQLCDQLTNLGLEVDAIESTYDDLTGVSVAEVVEIESIDAGDGKTISKCSVSTGSQTVQVVCGAPNVRVGMRTAYAKDGATLNDRDQVKRTRVYGVESDGMLCSGAELAINDDASVILDLPSDLPLGDDIKNALGLQDTTIDIDLTPNRGDCLSIRGVAREVGVVNQLPVAESEIQPVAPKSSQEISVTLANPEGCPRYLGRVISDVDTQAQTPTWMVQRLVGCGLRPIDPIVDVTNYVMLELGQPLHAFDLANTRNGIVVRDAKEGEALTLLDGSEIEFDAGTLLITDGDTPLAIAGVMGGELSGINESTKDVFLECAYFHPDAIIGTPRKYGLQTDASLRYERGVDPCLQYDAIERATELLCEIVKGTPGPVTIAESEIHLPSERQVSLRKSRLTMLVGESIADERVGDIFQRLGFDVKANEEQWSVKVPSYRFDLNIEEDLVEEVCRVHGYNEIGASYPNSSMKFDVSLARTSESLAQRSRIAELGYFEVINYSFIEQALNDRFVPDVEAPKVENPIASQYAVMRKSLIPGLLGSAANNMSRQQENVRLFEYGKCFAVSGGETTQEDRLSGVVVGRKRPEGWAEAPQDVDFYDVKGDLERLLAILSSEVVFERSSKPYLHPGEAATIVADDQKMGDFGRLHPEIAMQMDLPESTFVFELDAEPLKQSVAQQVTHIAPFPYVRRDLALLIAKDLPAQTLTSTIQDELGGLLKELTVFDVYAGENIDPDKKSIAIGLLMQDDQATLTDEKVAIRINDLLAKLTKQFNIQQR